VILTGGNDLVGLPGATHTAPERDRFEAVVLEHCTRRGLPVLGVCRGAQFLARHHGADLVELEGHVGTSHEVSGRRVGSYHRYGLQVLPLALQPMATAEDGTIEAFRHRELPQQGVMWHPEREQAREPDLAMLREVFGGTNPCGR